MKLEMRKPTYSEIYTYKNVFWFAFAVFVFAPFVNSFAIQLVILYTNSNVVYQSLAMVLAFVSDGVSLISNYAGLAVLSLCIVYFGGNAKGVIRLAYISHAVTLVSSALTYLLYTGTLPWSAVFMLIADGIANLAVTALVHVIVLRYAIKRKTFMAIEEYKFSSKIKKHPYTGAFVISCAIFGAVQLIVLLYRMIGDFLDPSLGVPVSVADTVYWVLEYAYIFVYTAIGFVISVLVGFMVSAIKSSGKEKFAKHSDISF